MADKHFKERRLGEFEKIVLILNFLISVIGAGFLTILVLQIASLLPILSWFLWLQLLLSWFNVLVALVLTRIAVDLYRLKSEFT